MWLTIHLQSLDIDEVARERVERRLRFALSRFSSQVGRVTVLLIDVNGPRGGLEMRCRVVVDVLGHRRVVVEDTDNDLNAAIDRAADRIGHAVSRILDRARLYAGLLQVTKN